MFELHTVTWSRTECEDCGLDLLLIVRLAEGKIYNLESKKAHTEDVKKTQ